MSALKKWAGGDTLSIGELKRQIASLEAQIKALEPTTYGTPEREKAKALVQEQADLRDRLADAAKNARGPRKGPR